MDTVIIIMIYILALDSKNIDLKEFFFLKNRKREKNQHSFRVISCKIALYYRNMVCNALVRSHYSFSLNRWYHTCSLLKRIWKKNIPKINAAVIFLPDNISNKNTDENILYFKFCHLRLNSNID